MLVVDDEKDSRVLISHFLDEFGCQVFTATNGEEGLEMARKYQPDLMTLDLIMPGITGWEVLKRLKADVELRGIPVVVVSVLANEGRGKLLGAVDLVATNVPALACLELGVPCPPMAALIVGFLLYAVLAFDFRGKTLEMPAGE